jgi:hypothetical protein
MKITRKRTARLEADVAQFLLGIAGLSLITFVSLRIGFGLQRAAFAYVILVAMIAALGRTSRLGPTNDRCCSLPELLLRATVVRSPG